MNASGKTQNLDIRQTDYEFRLLFQRLLVSCLEPDPSLRISAAAALGHPSLAKCPPLTK